MLYKRAGIGDAISKIPRIRDDVVAWVEGETTIEHQALPLVPVGDSADDGCRGNVGHGERGGVEQTGIEGVRACHVPRAIFLGSVGTAIPRASGGRRDGVAAGRGDIPRIAIGVGGGQRVGDGLAGGDRRSSRREVHGDGAAVGNHSGGHRVRQGGGLVTVHCDPVGENRPAGQRVSDGDPNNDLSAGRQRANMPITDGASASIRNRCGSVEMHVAIECIGDDDAGCRGAAGIGIADGVRERCARRGRVCMCLLVQCQYGGVYRGGDGSRNRGSLTAIRRSGIGEDRSIRQRAV